MFENNSVTMTYCLSVTICYSKLLQQIRKISSVQPDTARTENHQMLEE